MRTPVERPTLQPIVMASMLISMALFGAEAAAQIVQQSDSTSMLERMYGPYAPMMRQIAQMILQIGIIASIALPFQAFFPGILRKPKILSYEYWVDIVYWLQGIWLSLISFYALADWVILALYGNSAGWIPGLGELPSWLQVVLAIWAFDFVVYWRHRIEHAFVGLWAFHAVHHSSEKVDILTTSRLHPGEVLLGMILNTAIIRMGFQPGPAALGFTLYLYYNYFIHTNVKVRFSGKLKYVFVTPFMHQWHHATDEAAAGKNLGVIFAWNDWLFGTAYHPDHWPSTFGLAGPASERVPQSYVRQLLYPLQLAYARLTAGRATVTPSPDSLARP